MSTPAPTSTAPRPALDLAAPAPPTLAGELARWSTGGIIVLGFGIGLLNGVFGLFLGIAIGGLVGFAIAGALTVARSQSIREPRVVRTGAIATWVQIAGILASVVVGALGYATTWIGLGSAPLLATAGLAGLIGGCLLLVGAVLSPERDFSRPVAIVVGPFLSLFAVGVLTLFP